MKAEVLLYLAAFIFSVGIILIVTKRNAIMMLLGIELMLNAANLNMVVFGSDGKPEGQMFALFIIIIAVCEAAVGMAIVLRVYHYYHTSVPDEIDQLKEQL
jgi:NADH:ubiquinone oxidoreductase subunit K